MIDALLFDKDGTLFDFRKSWGAWAGGFLSGLAQDADHGARLAAAVGYLPDTNDFLPDSPVIAATAADIAAALQPHLGAVTLAELTQRINQAAATAAMAEAVPLVPLFTALRGRGLKLGVVTNDSERPAQAHIAAHGLTDLLDFVAGYDSGYGAKPGPGMLNAFVAQQGLQPGRVAMIGDSLHDLEAGRAAGMIRVAVLTGIATRDDLAPHADVVLADIGGLPAWLDGLKG
ncbi:HAD family hydrolase [Xinfangfangia sp. D13-10-4-6]|uniref:HAD family hydrolase n=1 Tax=Pseudogemmobacter hezensis TaxID=2737662 RepID=UPI001554A76D|nr:HAD family hydrolase [Pseudogemmobacter hezensis]NPD13913.1 HAD family hydrolase [Pseudogemmobacter hezensis]